MPSLKRGKRISSSRSVSVENITRRGLWLHVRGAEHFLDFDRFPWFRAAKIGEIQNVRFVRGSYLRWPDLDVDLELDCLAAPEKYPLVYR
jgi:hypothetical protein